VCDTARELVKRRKLGATVLRDREEIRKLGMVKINQTHWKLIRKPLGTGWS
jgi:hypothetical protein